MAVNRNNPDAWDRDTEQSIDMFNDWFIHFAPQAFRQTRANTADRVIRALEYTDYMRNVESSVIEEHPEIVMILRMATCPPIARDRLMGDCQ